ncbi:Fosfomycin resistance protein AbaF [subsurface metagenome]
MAHSEVRELSPRARTKVILAAILGSSLEWYDFYLYATASALVFGKMFFPGHDPKTGVLLSFATFAVGFFVRPLGSIILANIGDRIGRKPVLALTLIMMGVASTGIGLIPSYESIGILAPILLILMRVVQGLGAGAELAGVCVYCTETAPKGKRGLYGSFGFIGAYAGILLSSLAFSISSSLPEADFLSWGWRIPFLLSSVLVLIGWYVRVRLDETPVFTKAEKAAAASDSERVPLMTLLRTQWPSLLTVVGITAGPFVGIYTYSTYAQTYLASLGVPKSFGSLALIVASGVAMVATPLFGAISDRVGRRPVVIAGSLITALFAFPFFWLLEGGTQLTILIAMIVGQGIALSLVFGPQGALLSELFGTRMRLTGFSVGRELSSILFAGLSPLVAATLVSSAGGAIWPVSAYVAGASVVSLIVAVLFVPETANRGLDDGVVAGSGATEPNLSNTVPLRQ